MLDGRIKGWKHGQPWRKNGKVYENPFEGIQTPDRYTLVLKLNNPDQNFPMLLAHGPAAAVAREVIEKYKDKAGWVMSKPVGTGPYVYLVAGHRDHALS